MRLFIGMPLSDEATRALSQLTMRLRSRDDGWRWSAPESWHITLQFLGNTSQEQCACIVALLRELHLPSVSIIPESFGFFARAGIFYLEVRSTEPIIALQQSVTAATAPCGFIAENRPYQPHVTLARIKGKHGIHSLSRLKAQLPLAPHFTSFLAEDFLLYESFTDLAGSRYQVRERFAFNNIEGS